MPTTHQKDTLRLSCYLAFALVATVIVPAANAQTYAEHFYDTVDYPMYADPKFNIKEPVQQFPTGIQQLWSTALKHDEERELQRQICTAIVRATEMGMKDLDPCYPELQRILNDDKADVSLKIAAGRAVITFKKPESYDALVNLSEDPRIARDLEPHLADLCPEKLLARWRDRLKNPRRHTGLVRLALQSLRRHGEAQSDGPLCQAIILNERNNLTTRVQAAKTLVTLNASLEDIDLAAMVSSEDWKERMLAAALLHTKEHVDSLEKLAADTLAPIASTAVLKIEKLAPERIINKVDFYLKHENTEVRGAALRQMATDPKKEYIPKLAERFLDEIPELRQTARDGLLACAKQAELKPLVLAACKKNLRRKEWQAIQQAVVALALLGDKSEVPLMEKYVSHSVPQVYITSTWALRRLRSESSMKILVARGTKIVRDELRDDNPFRLTDQLCQVFFAIKEMEYMQMDAIRLMERCIPADDTLFYRPRAAAMYAIGHLYSKELPEPEKDTLEHSIWTEYYQWKEHFITELKLRVDDEGGVPPEGEIVKRIASVALARMGSKNSVPLLQKWLKKTSSDSRFNLAIRWALERLTGKQLPPPKPRVLIKSGWPLEPLISE